MASNFLKSTITLLSISLALSIATAFVLDIDGEPLFNGRQYYIIPQTIGIGGGLTRTTKIPDVPSCPYYVTRDNDETSSGAPLTITSPLRILFTPLSSPVNIGFEEVRTICSQTMGWQVIPDNSTGQLYVVTGGSPFDPAQRFTIELANNESSNNNVYKIRYVGDGSSAPSDVGFFKDNGLVGITDEIPLTVVFKKAFAVVEETNNSSS